MHVVGEDGVTRSDFDPLAAAGRRLCAIPVKQFARIVSVAAQQSPLCWPVSCLFSLCFRSVARSSRSVKQVRI